MPGPAAAPVRDIVVRPAIHGTAEKGSDLHLVEVHLTAVEGPLSEEVRRRVIEANLAVLEPLVQNLHRRLHACGPQERRQVAGSRR